LFKFTSLNDVPILNKDLSNADKLLYYCEDDIESAILNHLNIINNALNLEAVNYLFKNY